jgi:hypothetical protein
MGQAIDADRPISDDEVLAALDAADDELGEAAGLPDELVEAPDPAPDKPARAKRAKAPRKPAARKPARDRAPRKPAARAAPLGKRVENAHTTLALGLSMVPQPWAMPVAQSLASQAEDVGKAWESLAKENPRVAEALERILTVSTIGALLGAYAPVVVAAVIASGKMPAGVAVPEQSAAPATA